MARKFEAEDDKPIERMYLVDGVYLPEGEFDKLIDKRAWWTDFWGEAFAGAVLLALLIVGVWLVKG